MANIIVDTTLKEFHPLGSLAPNHRITRRRACQHKHIMNEKNLSFKEQLKFFYPACSTHRHMCNNTNDPPCRPYAYC